MLKNTKSTLSNLNKLQEAKEKTALLCQESLQDLAILATDQLDVKKSTVSKEKEKCDQLERQYKTEKDNLRFISQTSVKSTAMPSGAMLCDTIEYNEVALVRHSISPCHFCYFLDILIYLRYNSTHPIYYRRRW